MRGNGVDNRKILLEKIKDYYSGEEKADLTNPISVDLMDRVCNDEEFAEDMAFLPIFKEDELTQIFYNYRTGESFIAINTPNGFSILQESYSRTASFAANIAVNLGLTLKIYKREIDRINDPELSKELFEEIQKLNSFFSEKTKMLVY